MPTPPGSIHYVEVVTPDVGGHRAICEQAFGWRFEGPVAQLGGAVVATLADDSLYAIRAPLHESETPVVRTYVRVDDIADAVERAVGAGAELALEPTEIEGHGTIAIYLRGGNQHGLWQLP